MRANLITDNLSKSYLFRTVIILLFTILLFGCLHAEKLIYIIKNVVDGNKISYFYKFKKNESANLNYESFDGIDFKKNYKAVADELALITGEPDNWETVEVSFKNIKAINLKNDIWIMVYKFRSKDKAKQNGPFGYISIPVTIKGKVFEKKIE